jgi:outer membrane lipoprotein SlyB
MRCAFTQMSLGMSLLLVLAAAVAEAQQPTRVRGTIERVDGPLLMVKSRDGAELTVRLPDNVVVTGLVARAITDIKAGDYVGSAAMPAADGALRALEVHIFPENMRGTGEGHRPHDLLPESTMTNATVAETVQRVDGHTLTLKYKDGEKTLIVPRETPIVTYVPGERSELKPGAKIFVVNATRQPDGTLQAARIIVGRDGLTPPM